MTFSYKIFSSVCYVYSDCHIRECRVNHFNTCYCSNLIDCKAGCIFNCVNCIVSGIYCFYVYCSIVYWCVDYGIYTVIICFCDDACTVYDYFNICIGNRIIHSICECTVYCYILIYDSSTRCCVNSDCSILQSYRNVFKDFTGSLINTHT